MAKPIHTERLKLDKNTRYGDQADKVAKGLEQSEGIVLFGLKQTHYVLTSLGEDGMIDVAVYAVGDT
jgi:hypothetical protein